MSAPILMAMSFHLLVRSSSPLRAQGGSQLQPPEQEFARELAQLGPWPSLLSTARWCRKQSSDSHRRRHYSRHLQLSPNRCSACERVPCQRKCLVLSNFRATSSPTSGVRPSKFHLLRSSHAYVFDNLLSVTTTVYRLGPKSGASFPGLRSVRNPLVICRKQRKPSLLFQRFRSLAAYAALNRPGPTCLTPLSL
jgi:hypothetical protein